MSNTRLAVLRNGRAIPRAQVPQLPWADFQRAIVGAVAKGQTVAALFADAPIDIAPSANGNVDLYVVLADDAHSLLRVGMTRLEDGSFNLYAFVSDFSDLHQR